MPVNKQLQSRTQTRRRAGEAKVGFGSKADAPGETSAIGHRRPSAKA